MEYIRAACKKLFNELRKNKKVYFFGAGKICRDILKGGEADKYHIEGIIDNNGDLWGGARGEIPIVSLADIMNLPKDSIIVVITNSYYNEVSEQLCQVGVKYLFYYQMLFENKTNTFTGNYSKWEDACNVSGGYQSDVILNKVIEAFEKIRDGEAKFERDSVPFYQVEYNYCLLSALFFIASKEKRVSVIDFGGSLGSLYYQHKDPLAHIEDIEWNIVEQNHFVDYAKKNIMPKESKIQFYYNIDEIENCIGNCLLISGSLQYLDKPYQYLNDFFSRKVKYMIVDRMPLWQLDDRIVVQHVPEEVYQASYPGWIFNEHIFKKYIHKYYHILWEWEGADKMILSDEKNIEISYKGFFCELRESVSLTE